MVGDDVEVRGQPLRQGVHAPVAGVTRIAVAVGVETVAPLVHDARIGALGHELGELGRAHGEELGAVVEGGVADAARGQAPADRATLVDQAHRSTGGSEAAGGDQARQAGTDDGDVDGPRRRGHAASAERGVTRARPLSCMIASIASSPNPSRSSAKSVGTASPSAWG